MVIPYANLGEYYTSFKVPPPMLNVVHTGGWVGTIFVEIRCMRHVLLQAVE